MLTLVRRVFTVVKKKTKFSEWRRFQCAQTERVAVVCDTSELVLLEKHASKTEGETVEYEERHCRKVGPQPYEQGRQQKADTHERARAQRIVCVLVVIVGDQDARATALAGKKANADGEKGDKQGHLAPG